MFELNRTPEPRNERNSIQRIKVSFLLGNRARAMLFIVVLCPLTMRNVCAADQPDQSEFIGAWAFKLPDGNPAWLKIREAEDQLTGSLLWSVGSARPVRNLRETNNRITFERQVSWRPYGESIVKRITSPFTGQLLEGDLQLSFLQVEVGAEQPSKESVQIMGVRIPPPPPKPNLARVTFGTPIALFNSHNLEGWKLSNPQKQNGWSVQNRELVNDTPKTDFAAYGAFGNLMTERNFEDFQLSIEYNVAAGGNSGIYLRGMYEAQVVDRDSRMQGIQGPGAIFGRIAPSVNAGKPGGEWNTYVLTLVDRHITVELNGQTVIDNQVLQGCTGGGILANDAQPGPILLQGDHTSVRYRTIELRPVLVSESEARR